ncbi:carbohydrate ABC transporter permease [Paludicola sp. MB14-C6]|uniref:carbohydrate ABC transporter permease n=1 Tax=Paludihabitans sp. MB14-C6 TaxID=3070656 RepID=UPI0027DD268B|nr:carbohydrate ABC transporter permease [Paludicola sp. MB14-C6]WMJ22115.1 carbohydrate ABC transporter permease [Paludicola sp. MB14-C6]
MKITSKGERAFDIINMIIMCLVGAVCFFPFIYMIALSFSSADAVINNKVSLWPVGFTIDAYKEIFSYPNFFRAYGNTIFYTIVGTFISLTMTILFAYPLSKNFLKGRSIIMKLVVFSMFFSGGLIPNYLVVASLHLTNTIWAMLLPFAINQFNLIILINFFKGIPEEIEEAAIIDGLDYFNILIRIVLPLSLPAIATISLYTAVFFWSDWFNGLIYLKADQFPVMLYLRNIVNGAASVGDGAGSADKTTIEITIKSAVIMTTTIPIICLYPFLQKFFVKGLTLGSVKG